MAITLKNFAAANVVYNAFRTEGNKTSYIGPAHTDLVKDSVIASSTSPKRTATSYGNRRASVNIVRSATVDVPGGSTEVKDLKIELVTSIPVGTPVADINELFARALSVTTANLNSIAVVGQTQV